MWIEVVTCRQRSRRNSRRWRRRRKNLAPQLNIHNPTCPQCQKGNKLQYLSLHLSFSLSVSPDPFTWDIILVLPKSWSEVFAVRRFEENGNSCSRNLFSRMRIGQCLLWMWTALVVTGNKHVVSTNSWVWKIFISNWCGWPLLTACKCLHTISHLHVVGLVFLICYIYMPAVVWMPRTSWSSTTRTRLWSTIFAKTRLVREFRFQHFRLISVARRSWANGSGIQTCPTWSSSVVGIRLQSSARMSSSAVWRYQRKESWEDRRQLLWCWGPYSVIATTFQSQKHDIDVLMGFCVNIRSNPASIDPSFQAERPSSSNGANAAPGVPDPQAKPKPRPKQKPPPKAKTASQEAKGVLWF